MKRIISKLTKEEREELARIYGDEGAAFRFWCKVAAARKLDPATIIATDEQFTALPLNHNKHWCWPMPRRCANPPISW